MPESAETSTDLPSVEGKENDGMLMLVRWLAPPSSSGLGRLVGKEVSSKHVNLVRRDGKWCAGSPYEPCCVVMWNV